MKEKAVKVLIDFIRQRVESCSVSEQIVLFNAIAEVAIDPSDRQEALEIVQLLSRAAALQLNFSKKLFGGDR